jgi:DNA-binding NarL/FixJ family response regulator
MLVRIAIVDDNPVYRHALVELLKAHGSFEITVSADVFPDLLDGVVDREPDLILMDESVFWELPEHKRTGFLGYFSDIPFFILALDPPVGLEVYAAFHPRISFLSKESGGLHIIQRMLEMVSHLDMLGVNGKPES